MEIVQPKICLTIEEAEELRGILWSLSAEARNTYEVWGKYCDDADRFANRLDECLRQCS